MASYKLIASLLVAFMLAETATCLRCILCDSYNYGEACGEKLTFTNDSMKINATNTIQYCYKFRVTSLTSDVFVARGLMNSKCLNTDKHIASGYIGTLSCCNTDDCNNSKMVKSSMILSLVSIMISLVLFK